MKARFTSIAELELKEAIEFYETQQAGLGAAFLAEAEATIQLIEAHPLAWMALSQERGVAEPIGFPTACFIKFVKLKS